MGRYETNDRVRHPAFGFGTVVDVQKDGVVEVVFDTGGRRRLSPKYGLLALITLEEETRLLEESQRIIEQTFAPADGPAAHGHRPHLSMIADDVTTFISQVLPTALRESVAVRCWGDDHAPLVVLPPEEPKAATVVWPSQYYGVVMLIRVGEKRNAFECVSAYPWFSEGVQHTVVIDAVHPWHGRIEGHVSGTVGGLPLTFFDALFARHKAHYAAGGAYRFSLTGIAYSCEVVETAGFDITDPEVIRILRGSSPGSGVDLAPLKVRSGGPVWFHPAEGRDRDDYDFLGLIREVTTTDFLGRQAWQVRATVAESPEDGSGLDLNVYIIDSSLRGKRVPSEGDALKGTMWVQGHLIFPEETSRSG